MDDEGYQVIAAKPVHFSESDFMIAHQTLMITS